MLLDVLTLLGALYVLLTIVEYLCSLLKPTGENSPNPKSDQEKTCNSCRQRPEQEVKPKIQYIIMANESGAPVQQQCEPDLDQYQSEILKRRKRIAAGEVKGFYLGTGQNEHDQYSSAAENEGNDDHRRHSSYSGDYNDENNVGHRKSLTKDAKSCDDPSIQSGYSNPNMVNFGKEADQGYYIDPNNWIEPKSQGQRQQQYQQRSMDDRRLSLDTVPVKLSAPITIIKTGSEAGSPFRVSENSAFTPIQPRRDASVERRGPFLSVTNNSLHAQSFPDVNADSGVNTTVPSSSAQGPIQITVVMRPTNGSAPGQQSSTQKVSSTLVWTSGQNQKRNEEPDIVRVRSKIDVCDTESKKDRQPSPVRLKMVQTVSSAFQEPHSESKIVQSEQKIQKDSYQSSSVPPPEPESPVKLKLIQPSGVQCEDTQKNFGRKPYMKSSTTALASTAALARATSAANYKNNYYSNSRDFDAVGHTPPPPPPSSELLTPQLLKKQSPLNESYQRNRQYYEQPQMALTRAMRGGGTQQQGPRMFYGSSLNETIVPQPYHPPTMATYEHPPSPRTPASDTPKFSFGTPSGQTPNFEGVGRQPRQQQRARYSPMTGPQQAIADESNVVWRPAGGGTAPPQHSLSVDEGIGNERSRSRERSRIRRPHDENVQPKGATFDFFGSSFDDDKTLAREITDQGVPTNEDVLKGGNVSSKTKLFEALAEQELQDVDSQNQHFYAQQQQQRRSDRWVPQASSVQSTPKHKKMERSHTVHTVRSLMAPDAYQYENAPYNNRNPYISYHDHDDQKTPSPRHSFNAPPAPAFYAAQKMQEMQTPPVLHVGHRQEAVEFPPAAISPRAVQREQAVIGKGHIQQAQVVQPAYQPSPQWHPPTPSAPQVQVQVQHAPASAIVPVPVQHVQAPTPPVQHAQLQHPPAAIQHVQVPTAPVHAVPPPVHVQPPVQPRPERLMNMNSLEEEQFEDEMSKMSIADKAKLFELKAEEQAKITKRKYNAARHKTVPVTTDEVMKARSVINEQLAKPVESQKPLKMHRGGTTEDEAEEMEEEDRMHGSRSHLPSASRNIIICQRTPDPRRSASRVIDDVQSDRDDRQATPSSTSAAPAVKPRRIVFLHSEHGGSATNLDIADLPPTTPTRKQPDQFPGRDPTPASDPNNNEKSENTASKSGDNTGITASLVNGFQKKPSPPARAGRLSEPPAFKEIKEIKEEIKAAQVDPTDMPYMRSIGVREKAKRLMNEISKHGSFKSTNGPMTNGHNGHMPSRIIVNHDDDEENGHNSRQKTPDNALDKFCTRAKDLDDGSENDGAKVEDDSFMHIVTAPVIRLQHFERPKPNRRHSTCGSRRSVPYHSTTEQLSDKNGAIIVNH